MTASAINSVIAGLSAGVGFALVTYAPRAIRIAWTWLMRLN